MKRALLVVAFVLVAGFGATPAQARHHHHHRHHAQHVRPIGAPVAPSFWSFLSNSGSDVVQAARAELGNGAIYGRRNLWCARFMNHILQVTGHRGTGSDLARSFASLPHTGLHVGAIAVMARRGGGHVGIVSGVTAAGDPIVISGNSGHRVRESVYPARRVVAFVSPQ